MSTQAQNASILIDALTDAAGRAPRTNEQKARIVENATKTWDTSLTNEQKAQNFNLLVGRYLLGLVRGNAEARQEALNAAEVAQAGDSAAGDL